MADKFKTGDVVQLKSGGPIMTVVGYHVAHFPDGTSQTSDTNVECTWFNEKNERKSSTFHEDTLEKADY